MSEKGDRTWLSPYNVLVLSRGVHFPVRLYADFCIDFVFYIMHIITIYYGGKSMDEWKEAKGTGLEVNLNGEIRNSNTKILRTPNKSPNGYMTTFIRVGDKGQRRSLVVPWHRVVAFAWGITNGLLQSEDQRDVDHINGIRNDNRVCNLQALTHKQNTAKRANLGHGNCKKVVMYDVITGNSIKEYKSLAAASRDTGIASPHICNYLKGNYSKIPMERFKLKAFKYAD